MLLTAWDIIIALCCLAILFHPTKEGVVIGCIFLISVALPELLKMAGFDGKWYASACFMGITLTLCLLKGNYPESKMADKLFYLLLLFEIPINVFGIFSWEHHWHLYFSNYIYDLTGYSPATALVINNEKADWLYLALAITNYTIALYILWDREVRKQHVGFGMAQFLGTKHLTSHLRFKDRTKWEK